MRCFETGWTVSNIYIHLPFFLKLQKGQGYSESFALASLHENLQLIDPWKFETQALLSARSLCRRMTLYHFAGFHVSSHHQTLWRATSLNLFRKNKPFRRLLLVPFWLGWGQVKRASTIRGSLLFLHQMLASRSAPPYPNNKQSIWMIGFKAECHWQPDGNGGKQTSPRRPLEESWTHPSEPWWVHGLLLMAAGLREPRFEQSVDGLQWWCDNAQRCQQNCAVAVDGLYVRSLWIWESGEMWYMCQFKRLRWVFQTVSFVQRWIQKWLLGGGPIIRFLFQLADVTCLTLMYCLYNEIPLGVYGKEMFFLHMCCGKLFSFLSSSWFKCTRVASWIHFPNWFRNQNISSTWLFSFINHSCGHIYNNLIVYKIIYQ